MKEPGLPLNAKRIRKILSRMCGQSVLVKEITHASAEQSEGISQVSIAV